MSRPVTTWSVAVVLCVFAFVPARASAQAYEGFNYPFSTPLGGLAGGSAWGSVWAVSGPGASITNVGLTHPWALPDSGLSVRTNEPTDMTRELDPSTGDITSGSSRTFLSFLAERQSDDEFTFHMVGLAGDPVDMVIASGGSVSLQYGGDPPVVSSVGAPSLFTTYLFVFEIVSGDVRLWVDPSGSLGTPTAEASAASALNYATVSWSLGIVHGLDEIHTGNESQVWAVPGAGTPVMLGLLLAGAARRRR